MREYLLVFLVALSVTYLLTVDRARDRAAHRRRRRGPRPRRPRRADPVPRRAGHARRALRGLPGRPRPAVPVTSEEFVFPDAGAVLLAGALVCAVGVIDDIFDLDALTKLGGQVLAAGAAGHAGRAVLLLPGRRRHAVLPRRRAGAVFTLLVVIGTMNAVNFVDGLDGLAAGVVGSGPPRSSSYCYFASAQADLTLATTGALLSAALAGACAASCRTTSIPPASSWVTRARC